MEKEDFGLVSIIIPVYNVESYLPECIESVLEQTYSHWELLLIDDGSSDGSPQICDEFQRKDSRIRAIHKENQGPSAARNLGIEIAGGDYIVFVDSDDWIAPGMLEEMAGKIYRYQTDLVMCGFERVHTNWRRRYRISPYSLVILQSQMELASVYKRSETNMFGVSIWAKLYRRDILMDNHIRFRQDVSYEEDCLFNLEYFRHVSTVAVLRDIFYFYRQLDVSLSKGYRQDGFGFLVQGYRGRLKLLEELGMTTQGARNIFMIVVKTTLIKIYDANLSRQEKMTEYGKIIAWEETQEACAGAVNAKGRLTRLLAKAVLHRSPRQVHATLFAWKCLQEAKRIVKKIIGRQQQ